MILQFKNEKTLDVILVFISALKFIFWLFSFKSFEDNIIFRKIYKNFNIIFSEKKIIENSRMINSFNKVISFN